MQSFRSTALGAFAGALAIALGAQHALADWDGTVTVGEKLPVAAVDREVIDPQYLELPAPETGQSYVRVGDVVALVDDDTSEVISVTSFADSQIK